MFYRITFAAAVLFTAISCEKKEIKADNLQETSTATAPQTADAGLPANTTGTAGSSTSVPAPANATSMNVTAQNGQPIQINPSAAKPGSVPAKVAPGMNPAHGEPGHRCDIPVGAPLSTPSKGAAPAATPQPIQVTPQAAPQAQATAPGMNPPHGQPGHRCDIPVGSPLSSAPAPTSSSIPATVAAPK